MTRMPINQNAQQVTSFSQISQHMQNASDAKPIRGVTRDGVQQLYTHAAWKPDGLTEGMRLQRRQKEQQGAAWIRASIDVQYGPGMGDRVFQHVSQTFAVLLTARVYQHDLQRIQQSIQTLQAADAQAKVDIGNFSSAPWTQAKAQGLLAVASNPNVSPELRDEAATALRINMMHMDQAARAELLTDADTGLPNNALTSALFTLKLRSGQSAFSVKDLTAIAAAEFAAMASREDGSTFFQDESLAKRLLANGIKHLDGVVFPLVARSVAGDMRMAIMLRQAPLTMGQNGRVVNPAFVATVLTKLDARLLEVAKGDLPTALNTFLGAISSEIDNGNPPKDPRTDQAWKGASLITNALLTVGLEEALKEEVWPGDEEVVTDAVVKSMHQAVYWRQRFDDDHPSAALNPGVNLLLLQGSGLNAFLKRFE